jgi:hypothetical protein
MMKKMLTLLALLFVVLSAIPILQCGAQATNPKITQDQYQWSNDMKRLKMTTPERGLIFKITISNEGNEPLSIDKLYINIRVESDSRQYWSYFKQLSIDYLYLPRNESDYRFVEVDFGGGDSIIGSYAARLTYSIGTYSYGEGTPIELYPFQFNVASEDTLQNAINQNPSAPIINIYVPVTLFSTGGITVIAWALWNRRKKRGG